MDRREAKKIARFFGARVPKKGKSLQEFDSELRGLYHKKLHQTHPDKGGDQGKLQAVVGLYRKLKTWSDQEKKKGETKEIPPPPDPLQEDPRVTLKFQLLRRAMFKMHHVTYLMDMYRAAYETGADTSYVDDHARWLAGAYGYRRPF